jgi:hypothetical protein
MTGRILPVMDPPPSPTSPTTLHVVLPRHLCEARGPEGEAKVPPGGAIQPCFPPVAIANLPSNGDDDFPQDRGLTSEARRVPGDYLACRASSDLAATFMLIGPVIARVKVTWP